MGTRYKQQHLSQITAATSESQSQEMTQREDMTAKTGCIGEMRASFL